MKTYRVYYKSNGKLQIVELEAGSHDQAIEIAKSEIGKADGAFLTQEWSK